MRPSITHTTGCARSTPPRHSTPRSLRGWLRSVANDTLLSHLRGWEESTWAFSPSTDPVSTSYTEVPGGHCSRHARLSRPAPRMMTCTRASRGNDGENGCPTQSASVAYAHNGITMRLVAGHGDGSMRFVCIKPSLLCEAVRH